MVDREQSKPLLAGEQARGTSGSNLAGRVGECTPEIITKKWICARFNIAHRTSRTCRRLRKLIFTDQLLDILNLSEIEWKRRQEFTRAESILIIRYLEL